MQLEQRLDGFGQDGWTPAQWDQLIRASSFAEIAVRDCKPVCIAGFSEPWPGLAIAWASIGHDVGTAMVPITRRICRAMELHPRARRFQMTVRVGFLPGHRWARMLGFRAEATMARYAPDGSDHVLYARCFERPSP